MNWASNELVTVLTFLLPGFVSAAIFYSFTSHPKASEFERVVQALIFTIVVQAFVGLVRATALWVGALLGPIAPWTKTGELSVSVLVAALLGLIAVRVANNDSLHRPMRKLGFTKENSYPSEWYSAFVRHRNAYVVLHLAGARRLYGWPEEWPNQADKGHFSIAEAEWLIDDQRVPVVGVSTILVPATDVEMVEFLPALSDPEE